MARRKRAHAPLALGLLCLGLCLWILGRLASKPDFPPPRQASLPAQDPAQPDTLLPAVESHNAEFAGTAPGYDPFGGEKEELITPLTSKDRILVRSKGKARKRPPAPQGDDRFTYPTARLLVSSSAAVVPLNVRDAAALVMPPADLP